MTAKKETGAKKTTKKTTKKVLTPFEQAMVGFSREDKIVSISIGDDSFDVAVKQELTTSEKNSIVAATEYAYFNNGELNRYMGDLAMDYIIFTHYTGLEFANELEKFDKFRSTIEYEMIKAQYPSEVKYIYTAINEKVKSLSVYYDMPAEETVFYTAFQNMATGIENFVDHLDDILTFFEDRFKSEDASEKVNFSDIISAMKMVEKQDENKIVKAVLKYQENKKNAEMSNGSVPAEKESASI